MGGGEWVQRHNMGISRLVSLMEGMDVRMSMRRFLIHSQFPETLGLDIVHSLDIHPDTLHFRADARRWGRLRRGGIHSRRTYGCSHDVAAGGAGCGVWAVALFALHPPVARGKDFR